MKQGILMRIKARRLLVICIALLTYVILAFVNTQQTLSHPTPLHSFILGVWVPLGFSLSVALIFLATGSLIWFYSRDRQVALLLFIFCYALMVTFVLETSTSTQTDDQQILDAIANFSTSLALFFLPILLLIFPKDHLLFDASGIHQKGLNSFWKAVNASPIYWYIFALFLFFCVGVIDTIISYLVYPQAVPIWLDTIFALFNILALTGSLVTSVISFRKSTSQEREQLKFFVIGVILSIAPLLLFTVIPQTINIYAIDPQITTLTIILLPISLGYSILRYQILVFDTYIRHTVTWIIAVILLAIQAYIVYVVRSQLRVVIPSSIVGAIVIVSTTLLTLFTWWLAKQLTERVVFKEMLRYRRMIDKPVMIGNEVLDLENIGQLITEAAMQTFKTPQVNLFVLTDDAGCYHLFPQLSDEQNDEARAILASRLASSLSVPVSTSTTGIVALHPSVEKRLVNARRPLLLYEVTRAEEDMPTGLSRYLTSSLPGEQNDPLIAPVRVQGRIIALLVLGERADAQSYAGPDFEIVEALISRYAPILETARMTEQLRAAYERQKELDVLKDQFIMTASHELRTPLTAVLGYIGLLKEHNETLAADMRAKFIAKAELGCDELVLMVNNIMDASRLEVDVNNIKVIPVLLHKPVYHVVEIMDSIATRQHRSITVDIPSELLVLADAMRLHQVLLNLISNALKYSPSGTSIEVSAIADEGDEEDIVYATICVRDYGAGVPLESQNQLFERFMRLERDMNSPTRGAGLGLYICKQLVEAMSGNIWVESTGKAGEGSRFFFTLRLAPAQTQANTLEHQNLSALV